MERFTVEVADVGGRTVVVVCGEVDLAVAARLQQALDLAVVAGADVVVDCAGVTFLDSSGLKALFVARQKASEVGADLALRAVSDSVARVLDLAGVAGLFKIESA